MQGKLFQSPKLKTGYRYENQFWNPGFTNGIRQFCRYQYFCYEILFYSVASYSQFSFNLLNQNLQNVKTPKSKLGSFVQRYSFKFRAQWCTNFLYCSVLTGGSNVNTRVGVSQPDMESIFQIKNQWNILVIGIYNINYQNHQN